MIVIGYQGIGKTTICKDNPRYIDFESSALKVNGERPADWFIPYCQMAIALSKQGYVVFTASHKEVREYLKDCGEYCVAIVPAENLRAEWLEKLRQRACASGLQKDEVAYLNAQERYEENINEIKDSAEHFVELSYMRYDLNEIIWKCGEAEKDMLINKLDRTAEEVRRQQEEVRRLNEQIKKLKKLP